MGRIAGYSPPAFPAALKPGISSGLLIGGLASRQRRDRQVLEAVPNALRRLMLKCRDFLASGNALLDHGADDTRHCDPLA